MKQQNSILSTRSTAALLFGGMLGVFVVASGTYTVLPTLSSISLTGGTVLAIGTSTNAIIPQLKPVLDTVAYDRRLLALAHVATSSPWYQGFLAGATSTTVVVTPASTTTAEVTKTIYPLWPARKAYPNVGALLPFNRIVAYYGNFYSKGMGILGEYPEEVVLQKLLAEKAAWEAADPTTPVMPAIEYIDVTAQGSAGKDGKYRLRMPDSQVDKALTMAQKIDAIVILDIQVGLSTLPEELPLLDKYWKMPQVHLALDPEFAMHNGKAPGRVIGSMSAEDINYAINYLSKIVRDNNLPPKILVVHRFTQDMVTGYRAIHPTPEVQVVVQMDGWGSPQRKKNTYRVVVEPEPVQFTGLKVFYKNDLKETPSRLLTPQEILNLTPAPSFIQYQ